MPFTARVSLVLPVSAQAAFDRLADHASWDRWMPASFRPAGRVEPSFRPGVRVKARVSGGPPVSIRVTVVDPPRELAWQGGVPGIFHADHHFFFEPRGESSVEVRSVETWSGIVPRLIRPLMLPSVKRVLIDQLEALRGSFPR